MPAASQTGFDLVLDSSTLDRRSLRRRDPDLITSLLTRPSTAVLDVYGDRLPNTGDGDRLHFRKPREDDRDELLVYLGEVGGREVLAVLRDDPGPREESGERSGGELRGVVDEVPAQGLRYLGMRLHADDVPIAVTATGIGRWHAVNGFCSKCGRETQVTEAGWVRHCDNCGRDHYPRTDPAVIMSVVDADDRLLLGRGRNFASNGMSVLAGFVEPGESLETAVAREVMEEVGVSVTDVRFLGDQPWPFPASLMVGFTCRATTTELTLDPEEIAAARWFTRAELADAVAAGEVHLSPRLSIARHLIEHWYGAPIDQPDDGSLLRRV
ncbi:NTP pyrophosphohydrolase [Flexivirga endophytica]|uniref:NAD(+) diphosphatase n=1 Tax=Flexivirga endophytica TaxID=1849103 RepID=A0A916X0S9_9MICO|nr:NAD(+) diphosphatase [Flexivirga endophytica]GGB44969.1 NTP pyrophosphohydrolase [Flexivirga endophytica]GHB68853.1 NTP pyrophosphohydrolase [Flexivirga endophytica]